MARGKGLVLELIGVCRHVLFLIRINDERDNFRGVIIGKALNLMCVVYFE